MTGGYMLRAKHVIHTVGPVWDGGGYNESEILKSCYNSTLNLASENGIKTIAFPCIATGVYLFPNDQACEIALTTVLHWLENHHLPEKVVFCCYEDEDFQHYQNRLNSDGCN